jgi:O-methyltransferase
MQNKLYTDLLKTVLLDLHRIDIVEYSPVKFIDTFKSRLLKRFDRYLKGRDYHICLAIKSFYNDRLTGSDFPLHGDTMIGLRRMNNIEYCVEQIIKDNIEGDFIETGVWRGGAVIFMNGLVQANGLNKNVWVADSFEGLPKPDAKYKHDEGDKHYLMDGLAIPLGIVKYNFQKYGLLTDNVKFLKGWFKDTLPSAPIEKLSLARLDGDMYESTWDALTNLYPKLSPGGFLIIDDWSLKGCQRAVLDYREMNKIKDAIIEIDGTGVYWRKS